MLQKFKDFFKKKKVETPDPDPIDPLPEPEAPKIKKDFFQRMVKLIAPEEKRKIKHRKRGDRHGKSLREARKMGVAE